MAGFVKLLSPDRQGNVDPNEYRYGSGWYIGDGLILTAGHVVYSFNEADKVANRRIVNLATGETNDVPGFHTYSMYGWQLYDYAGEFLRVAQGYPDPLPNPTPPHPNLTSQIGSTTFSIRSKDQQFVAGSGSVDGGDAGVVLFLNRSDAFSTEMGLATTGDAVVLSRRGATSTNNDGTLTADPLGFRYSGPAKTGDSGSAVIMHFEGKEFILGSVSSITNTGSASNPSGPASGIMFNKDQFSALMTHLEASQSGNVSSSEPTNLIIGSSSGDTADGTYRADIILGRGGADTLSDGDEPGGTVWANDSMFGGEGNDTLRSGRGADLLHGGDHRSYVGGSGRVALEDDGVDEVSYVVQSADASKGVRLQIGGTAASSLHSANPDFATAVFLTDEATSDVDTLISIEKITATNQKDTLSIKDLKGDLLAGSDGKGGLAEFDMAANPEGLANGDLIDFHELTVALKVDLQGERIELKSDSSIGFKVKNAENVRGGKGDDEIIGNASDNQLNGGDGSDKLKGGEGDDELRGGDNDGASDEYEGGAGKDKIYAETGDIVHSPDRDDTIFLNGKELKGGERHTPPPNPCVPRGAADEGDSNTETYVGKDGERYSFNKSNSTLTVTALDGSTLTIDNWTNGAGHIFLKNDAPPIAAAECNHDPLILDLNGDRSVVAEIYDVSVYFDMNLPLLS